MYCRGWRKQAFPSHKTIIASSNYNKIYMFRDACLISLQRWSWTPGGAQRCTLSALFADSNHELVSGEIREPNWLGLTGETYRTCSAVCPREWSWESLIYNTVKSAAILLKEQDDQPVEVDLVLLNKQAFFDKISWRAGWCCWLWAGDHSR